jgi:ATP-dependent DNA helicase RecG
MESPHVERKASLSTKSKVEEAICAFANDLPGSGKVGVVLIGVDDKTGRPTGLEVSDQLLLTLTNIRSDGNILPFPNLTVYKATLDGVDLAVVEVKPSPSPPVRLRGRTVVRPGPRGATATRDEERILVERRRSFELSFDQRSVHGSTLADLDLRLFERELLPSAVTAEVLQENNRSPMEQLAALHLASPDGEPNVAGLLVLGSDPTGFIPGAYIQFLRLDGTELSDAVIDRKELIGPLPEVLRRLDEITNAHIRVATRLTDGPLETRLPDYPLLAMQQLLRNAVMHRNYETSHAPVQWFWFTDRVEIHNPGGLFGRVTPKTFGTPGGNDYRNPTVAAALHQLGFVQRFGMGVPLARKACAENGNPALEFVFQEGSFAVVLKARP